MPVSEALAYAVGIAQALKHWHDRGEAYGCLIPAAVVCEDDEVILGPARVAGPTTYRAPELWTGGAYDCRSDLFSLGAICYEMFSGRAPFRGKDEAALRRAVLERNPEPLEDLPPRLARTLAACLEKKPERRLQRIGLLVTELRLHEIECRPATPAAPARQRLPAKEESLSRPMLAPAKVVDPREPATTAAPGAPLIAAPVIKAPGYLSLIFRPYRCCPRCGSNDLRDSRPQSAAERGLVRMRVRVLRCQRCYSRFVRAGIWRAEIDEAL